MTPLPHDPVRLAQSPGDTPDTPAAAGAGAGVADDAQEITQLLHRAARGDAPARDQLYAALYRELSRLARRHLATSGTISLDASAVLHDAFLRISAAQTSGEFVNRREFFGYASAVMRNVIVDYVRQRQAHKRGSGERQLTLNTALAESLVADDGILDLHEALAALERIDARCHHVVEMRYFGGLTEEEIADVLAISVPTVKRDWRKARAFLFQHLQPGL